MIETLIFCIVLLFINLILLYKPIPIVAFPLMLFTLYIYASEVIYVTTLPLQPLFTIFLMFLNIIGLLVNALDFKAERKNK